MYLFLEKKGYFTFRDIMQFLFFFNVLIFVQQSFESFETDTKWKCIYIWQNYLEGYE